MCVCGEGGCGESGGKGGGRAWGPEQGWGKSSGGGRFPHPWGRGLTASLPVGRTSGCGQGAEIGAAQGRERMRRPARSATLCVAGLPGAAERERVPEQHPRVPARLRGIPAPGGG